MPMRLLHKPRLMQLPNLLTGTTTNNSLISATAKDKCAEERKRQAMIPIYYYYDGIGKETNQNVCIILTAKDYISVTKIDTSAFRRDNDNNSYRSQMLSE
mmetsp:Transcript_501/g.1508  ORF Transcript_501/g.1508 Transcript_501/m.1508 type:complete len:100 (-) Transcript_501:145-444(-)